MDSKKRTTIIALVFLTILLGVVSVIITIQVRRNAAPDDSQAYTGNIGDVTASSLYDSKTCDDLVGDELTASTGGTLLANDLVCSYEDSEGNVYTIEVIKSSFTTVAELKTQLELELDSIVDSTGAELSRGSIFSLLGQLEESCVGFAAGEHLKDSYLKISTEDSNCTNSLGGQQLSAYVNNLAYEIYNYFI